MTDQIPLTLIKLGGAVITNKEIPESVRDEVLQRLVREIASAWKEMQGRLIVGNGAGSFAHVPAGRYKTIDGFMHDESRIGMAITQDAAARLNRIVVHALIDQGIPAVTVAPSSTFVTSRKQMDAWFPTVLTTQLSNGLLPVVYGDVLADTKQGCTIWSTDTLFSFLARELPKHDYTVDQIIHVTEAGGVWKDVQTKEIYQQITPAMIEEIQASMVDTKGFDVTGGMWHKIKESIELAKLGISTRIVSGLQPQVVYNTIRGLATAGTLITK